MKKKSNLTKNKEPNKTSSKKDEPRLEKILVENFVSLQKVITNLSVKLNNLTNQISQLLNLFEISAKVLAKKEYSGNDNKNNQQIIKKIDDLLEQNKIIARGISLLHEPELSPKIQQSPPLKPTGQNLSTNTEGYQRSISSQPIKRGFSSSNQRFVQSSEE